MIIEEEKRIKKVSELRANARVRVKPFGDMNAPVNLPVLRMPKQNIDFLEVVPDCVMVLDVCGNNLTELPEYNWDNVISLDCSGNMLTKLPEHMPNLVTLRCTNNQLKYIGNYPKLKQLDCDYNVIECIENLPELETISCTNNNLTKLGDLPKLDWVYVDYDKVELEDRWLKLYYNPTQEWRIY